MDFKTVEEENSPIMQNGCRTGFFCLLGAIALCLGCTLAPRVTAWSFAFVLGALILRVPFLWLFEIFKKWRAKTIYFPEEIKESLQMMLRENNKWDEQTVQECLRQNYNLELSDYETAYWLRKIQKKINGGKTLEFSLPPLKELREFLIDALNNEDGLLLLGILWIVSTLIVGGAGAYLPIWIAMILAVPVQVLIIYLFWVFGKLFVYLVEKIESFVE